MPKACAILGCREGVGLGAHPGLPEPGLRLGACALGVGSFQLGFLLPSAGAGQRPALHSRWAGHRGPRAALTGPPPPAARAVP